MRKITNAVLRWLILRLEPFSKGPPPVTGWLVQLLMLVAWIILTYRGRSDQAAIFLVGSLIIGTVRAIERERRGPDAKTG